MWTSAVLPLWLAKGQLAGFKDCFVPANNNTELMVNLQVSLLVSTGRILSRIQLIQPQSGHQD